MPDPANPNDQIDSIGLSAVNYMLAWPDELPPSGLLGEAIVLGHELGHAVFGCDDEGNGGNNVQNNENPVRAGFGVPYNYATIRESYNGIPVQPGYLTGLFFEFRQKVNKNVL